VTKTARALLLGAALLIALPPTFAQGKKIYRCEDAAGRVAYADEPCPGGKVLDSDDARSSDERRAADEVVNRERALGERLARERRADEKAARAAGPAVIPHSAAIEAARKPAAKPGGTRKKAKKNTRRRLARQPGAA
jgi:hypothetical protein